jgi:hypothetical protein
MLEIGRDGQCIKLQMSSTCTNDVDFWAKSKRSVWVTRCKLAPFGACAGRLHVN